MIQKFKRHLQNVVGYKFYSCDLVFTECGRITDKKLREIVKAKYGVNLIINEDGKRYSYDRYRYYKDKVRFDNIEADYELLMKVIENFCIYNDLPYGWVRNRFNYDYAIYDDEFEWGDIIDTFVEIIDDVGVIECTDDDTFEEFISYLKGYEEDTILQYTDDEVIDLLFNYCSNQDIDNNWIEDVLKWSTHIKRYKKECKN